MKNSPATAQEIETILYQAAERGAAKALPYAGEVTPLEAFELQQAGAKIIDVRYPFEHEYVGRIAGSHLAPWKLYPEGKLNPDFVAHLKSFAATDEIVLLLCRSGVRSHAAGVAAAAAGYKHAHNVLGGFEGDLDTTGHRGNVNGWRHAGLPWVQS
jgi:rhodanese-related sulfurtransferase